MSVSEITQRREERAALITQMRGLIDAADKEKRDLSGEETGEWDKMDEKVKAITADIERRERLEAIKPTAALQPTQVPADTAEVELRKAPESFAEYRTMSRGPLPQDDGEYRSAFYKYVAHDVLDVTEMRALSKATSAAGGYLVPTSFERELIRIMRDFGAMRDLATVTTTSSGEPIQIPAEAGIGVASWVAENAAIPETDDSYTQVSLGAYKVARGTRASLELLQDAAFDLESEIANSIGASIGITENTAYVVGDGSGKATGITTQTTAGKTGATGQTTTVTTDDLIDLYFSVMSAYRRNGTWLMNEGGVKGIMKLKDTTGQYIWSPGITAGAPDTILGRPVRTDPDMPVMAANAKSILFGDFRYYRIRDVAGFSVQRLNELYAMNGQIGFVGIHRTDGKLVNTQAVKHYANSAT